MAMATDSKPGALLRAAREKAGLTRHQVAASLGLTYQRLSDVEADRSPVSLEKIVEICQAIGCDPHSIDPRLASNRRK